MHNEHIPTPVPYHQQISAPSHHILSAIGNTPLVYVPFSTTVPLYAKLEYLNPGGSVKDRTALYMIECAEKEGLLAKGGTIIDASSGNYGIALAMIGAAKGYNVIITTTHKISTEKRQTMEAYGAHVVLCESASFIEHPNSYHSIACKLHQETPNSFMPNQYFSPLNAQAHYVLTGPEIWQQTQGKITHFFAAVGSGGTIYGAGKYLKEKNPAIKIIGLDAENSMHSTAGKPKPYKVEGMGIDFYSEAIDYNLIDEIIPVSDENAFSMLKILARNYGFLTGLTSGAVAWGIREYLPQLTKHDYAVMIFSDSGRAYLSKNVY